MPYLVDTNVLIRAFVAPDEQDDKYKSDPKKYEEDKLLHLEAKRSIEELRKREEDLYLTEGSDEDKGILKEAEKVAKDKVEENGFGFSEEKTKQLLADIKQSGYFKILEEEVEARVEKEADLKAKQITETEGREGEDEKKALKDEIKKELKAEIEKKELQERSKAEQVLEEAKAKAEKEEKNKEARKIKKAKNDIPHVATAKTHELDVLTFNKEDFDKHEGLSVKRPHDIVLDLKPEQIANIREIENPKKPGYEGTKTYEVELASGHKAELNVRGDFTNDKQRNQEIIKDGYLWTQDTINRLEQWKKEEEPVKVRILENKGFPPPDPPEEKTRELEKAEGQQTQKEEVEKEEKVAKKIVDAVIDEAKSAAIGAIGGSALATAYDAKKAYDEAEKPNATATEQPKQEHQDQEVEQCYKVKVEHEGTNYTVKIEAKSPQDAQQQALSLFEDKDFVDNLKGLKAGQTLNARVDFEEAMPKSPFQAEEEKKKKEEQKVEIKIEEPKLSL